MIGLALSAGPSRAAGVVDEILGDLRAAGYDHIEVSRTLLGRTRIEADSATRHREIIVNPSTGEILRDYWETIADGDAGGSGKDGEAGDDHSGSGGSGSHSGSGGSGSGGSGSGSNSGSGGSGSGGSGSNSGSGGSGGSGSGGSGSGGGG